MSIFTQVPPFAREHKTKNLNYSICNRIQTKDRVLYVHGKMSEIHNLTMGDLSDLITIHKNEEILESIDSRFDYEVYTYIIGRNSKIGKKDEPVGSEQMSEVDKRGDFVFLAVNVKTPFEIGTKHMELMAYALKKELLDIPIVYVAGEMIKIRDEDGRIKLLMNFLSGSYMADYKAQWMNFLLENADLDIERSQIEMYWFNKDIRNIVMRLTGTERVEYSNLDFVMSKDNVPKLQFYPEVYKILKQKGIGIRFFTNEESCRVADVVTRRDTLMKIGVFPMMTKISFRQYMTEVSPNVFELKPEFANYLDNQVSLEELMGEGVVEAGAEGVGAEQVGAEQVGAIGIGENDADQVMMEGTEGNEADQVMMEGTEGNEADQVMMEGTEGNEADQVGTVGVGTEDTESESDSEELREEEQEEQLGEQLDSDTEEKPSKEPEEKKPSFIDNLFSGLRSEPKPEPEEGLPRLDVPTTESDKVQMGGRRTKKHRNKSSSKTQRVHS
jgi:hypothetical protein